MFHYLPKHVRWGSQRPQGFIPAYNKESAKPTLLVSHLYTLDHAILSFAHYLFFNIYWYEIPHDGRRTANSQAQIDLINLAASRGEIPAPGSEGAMEGQNELRVALAEEIWRDEKVYAGWALVFGWLLKVRADVGLECHCVMKECHVEGDVQRRPATHNRGLQGGAHVHRESSQELTRPDLLHPRSLLLRRPPPLINLSRPTPHLPRESHSNSPPDNRSRLGSRRRGWLRARRIKWRGRQGQSVCRQAIIRGG